MRKRCWLCGEDLIVDDWCWECSTEQPPEPDVVDEQQGTPLDQLLQEEEIELAEATG
jgi:hypothetical protein